MELQKKIGKWLENEKFVTFANKRIHEEILHVPENHYLDPKHEELEEGFDYYNCYAAPLALDPKNRTARSITILNPYMIH